VGLQIDDVPVGSGEMLPFLTAIIEIPAPCHP
jgi:hypothetical protein